MGTITQSVTLIPSNYTGLTGMTINSSYPITRGYSNADSTEYTRFDVNTSTTGSVFFLFDTSSIPAGATITSVTARGKARVSNTSRVTSTVMQLYSGSTAKGSNTTFGVTTASTQNLSPGNSWTRSDLSDLRLKIGGTASSSTSSRRIDFYGADVTVTYTVTTYTVSATGDGTLDPSTSQEIPSGGSYTLHISGLNAKPTVTDNNTDVTSQLTESTEETTTLIPNGNTVTTFTATNITNAYADKDSDNYAQLALAGSSTGTVYLDFQDISIPSGATITSVTCQATLQFNNNGSTSGFTSSCQMYAGSTAKGSSYQWVSSGSAVAKNTYSLTVGSWTASEINNARFYLTATNSARSTSRQIYIYGISFNITYESSGVTYIYTISSVSANHTIVVSAGGPTEKIYFKNNGSWVQATKVYKKVNGSWVEQSNLSTVFDSTTNYVKG